MADKKIYELNHEQKRGYADIKGLMTERQHERGLYYREKYLQRKAELEPELSVFNEIMKLYACERDPDPSDPSYPNNFIPLITPVVEGQTAAMMEGGIEYRYLSNNPSHQRYMPKLEAAGAYCRRINNAENQYKDFTRLYESIGNAWLTVMWEKSYSKAANRPDGYPRIMVPDIGAVLVDGSIKDYKDLQHAAYIIHEIGTQDIAWARREYGNDMAEAISAGLVSINEDGSSPSVDDLSTFTLLHVWTRDNEEGNLQLIEMDSSGLILRESDPSEPYYRTVDNEYPFYFARMIPRLNNFYGFGDGKILAYMQKYINNLADELELSVRFNSQPKTYIDPLSDMDPDQYDSDPSHPILCKNPRQNVLNAPAMGINNVVLQTIQFILDQAQRATRFSDIMNGTQQGVSATATQINGQMSQGSVGIRDKAADIQRGMAWCDRYCLRLCLGNWKIPFWVGKFRNASDEGGSEFLDMSDMAKIPAVIPATGAELLKRMKIRSENPDMKVADYEPAYDDESGEPIYVDLDYNVEVKLSAGFPRGKNDLFNQLISLMQVVTVNPETGVQEPVIELSVVRSKLEEILGFKLSSNKTAAKPSPIIANASQINPLSANGEVAQPQGSQIRTQPSNLMGTVPLARDNRGMQL